MQDNKLLIHIVSNWKKKINWIHLRTGKKHPSTMSLISRMKAITRFVSETFFVRAKKYSLYLYKAKFYVKYNEL